VCTCREMHDVLPASRPLADQIVFLRPDCSSTPYIDSSATLNVEGSCLYTLQVQKDVVSRGGGGCESLRGVCDIMIAARHCKNNRPLGAPRGVCLDESGPWEGTEYVQGYAGHVVVKRLTIAASL